jgi:hypothetical protein
MKTRFARFVIVPMIALALLLTAGAAFAQVSREEGTLKICKVAGPGVPLGTPFTFTVGFGSSAHTVTVTAGPDPGGNCVIVQAYPIGATVTVTETIPVGGTVVSIDVEPPNRTVPGTLNTAAGTVEVHIGPGVTEVTYKNKKTGYIEICKRGDVKGSFTFFVNPGNLGPFTVPAGECSPAIEVPVGTVTVHEAPVFGAHMSGCTTLPVNRQGPCDLGTQTSTVMVLPGDVSTQTIVFITNRPIEPPIDPATAAESPK